MKGLEMMLANLIGVKPEEMRAQVEQALALMKSGADAAAQIQRDLNAIKKHLGIEEDNSNGGQLTIGSANGSNRNGHAPERIEL